MDLLLNLKSRFIRKTSKKFFVNSNIYLKKASNSQNHIKQFNLKNCVRKYENLIKKL